MGDTQTATAPQATEGGQVADTAAKGEGLAKDVLPVKETPKTAKEGGKEAQKLKFKLNLNGKEEEKEFTLEEIQQRLQKGMGIEARIQELTPKVEAAEKFLKLIQEDPKQFRKLAREQGMDPDKWASDMLWEKIRWEKLTPEQQELEVLKAEKDEQAKRQTLEQEAKTKEEADRKTLEWAQKFEAETVKVLDEGKVPKSRLAVALVAQYVDAALANGKEMGPADVLPYVVRDLQQLQQATIGSLDGEALLEYLGPEICEKVSKARVAKLQKGDVTPKPPAAKQPTTPDPLKGKTGKAYFRALMRQKSEQGIGAFGPEA